MDQKAIRDRNDEVDIESGLKVSVQNSSKDPVSGVKLRAKLLIAKAYGAFFNETIKCAEEVNLSVNVKNSKGVSADDVKLGKERSVDDHLERKVAKEKRKKTSNKKSLKPPRPPRGPSLDAADQKLIKEITELAMLKRARIEQMKSLKKIKAAKLASQSSTSGNLLAMLFTILFCVVIIFQGMSSGGSSATPGSLVSTETKEGGLITVQFSGNPTANDPNAPGSDSLNLVELVAGSDHPTNIRRAALMKKRK